MANIVKSKVASPFRCKFDVIHITTKRDVSNFVTKYKLKE